MINTLLGKSSALRVLPLDVVANMYRVRREEAQRIKEAFLFTLPLDTEGMAEA